MKSRKLTITLFLLYLLALSSFVLFKTKLSFAFLNLRFSFAVSEIKRSINLIPFGDMLILNGAPSYSEVIYNGLVFVPFGIFLCMLKKKKSFLRLIVPILLTSLFFEAAQYVFVIGASDITDVLANTLGGIAGIGMFFILQKICKENVYKVVNITALVFVIGLAFIIGITRLL